MQAAKTSSLQHIRQRLMAGSIELAPLAALPFVQYPWPIPIACAILPFILRQLVKPPILRKRLTESINLLLTLQFLNLIGYILVPILLTQIFNFPQTALFAMWAAIPFTLFIAYTIAACTALRFLQALSGKSPCKWGAFHWLTDNNR